MRGKPLLFIAKVCATGIILFFLFWLTDPATVLAHIKAVPLWAFAYAAAAYIVATFVGSLRWSLLLAAQGIAVPLGRLFAYNLSFAFYVVALPTGKIAAEGVRIYQLISDAQETVPREKIVIASLMDRATAAFSFACIALPFFLIAGSALAIGFSSWVWYAALLAFILLIAMSVFPSVILQPLSRLLPAPLNTFAISLENVFRSCAASPKTLVAVLALSLCMNAITASGLYVLAQSLDLSVSFLTALSVFSLGMLAAILPISVGGVGIKEGTFAYVLSAIAETTLDVGFSVSLVMLGASFVAGALGALVEFYRHFVRPSL